MSYINTMFKCKYVSGKGGGVMWHQHRFSCLVRILYICLNYFPLTFSLLYFFFLFFFFFLSFFFFFFVLFFLFFFFSFFVTGCRYVFMNTIKVITINQQWVYFIQKCQIICYLLIAEFTGMSSLFGFFLCVFFLYI